MTQISSRLLLQALTVVALAGVSSFAQDAVSWTLRPGGGWSVSSTNEFPSTRAGYARIQSLSGTAAPSAMQFLKINQNGTLVSEAAIGAAAPIASARVRALLDRSRNTGIAVINPSALRVEVTFLISLSDGSLLGRAGVGLAPGQHIAALISERPFNLRGPFDGIITINSTAPVSILTTRGRVNERSEFLLSVAPVADLTVPPDTSAVLPEFAEGAGWATEIALMNPTDRLIEGSLEFWNNEGERTDRMPYGVPAAGIQIFDLAAANLPLRTGYIRIVPVLLNSSPVASASISIRKNGIVISEHTVSTVREGAAFRTFVEAPRTALILTNTNHRPATVRLEVLTLGGIASSARGTAIVPANGRLASFLDEIPGFRQMPANHQGVLVVSASDTRVGVAAFHSRFNQRGDFLMNTLPIINDNDSTVTTEVILPHFVIGGDYITQFVLLGRPADSTSGTLQFLNQGGDPMPIMLR